MMLRRLTCAGLVAALLFAGLPAWQHAHAGGDLAHDHQHEHHATGESHSHLHVILFGVEFTLPIDSPDGGESDRDDSSRDGNPTYVVSAPANLSANQASVSIPLCEASWDTAQRVEVAPTFRPKTASAAPLCDAARHERSGVLLV